MRASVAVVILNWNNFSDTMECVSSIPKYDEIEVSVVVVDNGSTDNSLELLRSSLSSSIFLLESGVNGGFGHGNNIGIQFALSLNVDFVWLLNNDTLVERDTILNLIKKMLLNNSIGALGSKIFYNDNRDSIQCYGGGPVDRIFLRSSMFQSIVDDSKIEFITGTSVFIRAEILKEMFGFRSEYFMYWEDVDMSIKIRQLGWRLGVAEDSVVYHKESASFKNKNLSSKKTEFFIESCIIFSKYNSPIPYLSMLVSTLPRIIVYKMTGKSDKFSAALIGVMNGIKRINAKH